VLFICSTEYELPVKRISAEALPIKREDAALAKDMSFTFPRVEDTAKLLYITGTTGVSKGIEITHANNIALAENVKYGTQMKENNVELLLVPISHSHGIRCCYVNMINRSAVVLTEGVFRVKKVFELIEKYKVTAFNMLSSAVLILEQLAKGKLVEVSGQIDYIQVVQRYYMSR